MQITRGAPAKLSASSAFLEGLPRRSADILAIVEVARDGYVPAGVRLREALSPRMFTADVPVRVLEQLLADQGVTRITPSSDMPGDAHG